MILYMLENTHNEQLDNFQDSMGTSNGVSTDLRHYLKLHLTYINFWGVSFVNLLYSGHGSHLGLTPTYHEHFMLS
jgi:hypothetical protein